MNSSRFSFAWFLRPQVLLLAVVGLAMLAYAFFNVLGAAGAGTLAVVPSSATVQVGDTFTTDITITGVSNLQGADITISYDSSKMSFQGFINNGSILNADFSPNTPIICSVGSCHYIAVRSGQNPVSFTGTGTLFTLTWLATNPGTSIGITASQLSDNVGQPIGHTTTNGTVTITPVPSGQADLVLSKTDSPPSVPTGGTLTYTLTSSNIGTATASNYFISDSIPAGVTVTAESTSDGDCDQISPFFDITPPWTGPATIRCGPFTTAAGSSDTVTLTVIVTAGSGTIVNSATTDSTGVVAESNEANNTDIESTTVTAGPDLVLSKSASASSVPSGGSITFTLTSSNVGSATASGYFIDDFIPAGVTVTAETTSEGDCDQIAPTFDETPPWTGPATIRCGPFTTTAGFTDTVTLTATVTAGPGTILNGALTDSDADVSESNEDADDPELVCTSVGEGTDVAPATEADNYDCLEITVTAAHLWGDVDCDGDVDSVDALKILQDVVSQPVSQTEPCPDIGDSVGITT